MVKRSRLVARPVSCADLIGDSLRNRCLRALPLAAAAWPLARTRRRARGSARPAAACDHGRGAAR